MFTIDSYVIVMAFANPKKKAIKRTLSLDWSDLWLVMAQVVVMNAWFRG